MDEANEHSISVWDWQKSDKGHKVTETKVGLDIDLFLFLVAIYKLPSII